tara:strand:+ start:7419 stop:7538 length:120 start_codon:yes stop_codon:yes gene_type:complete
MDAAAKFDANRTKVKTCVGDRMKTRDISSPLPRDENFIL